MKLKYAIENGCHRCTSHCTNNNGYVTITIDKKTTSGHRYVYIQKHGNISNEVLRHTCDNRWCINPDHLVEGSHADNVRDRVDRNRSAIGTQNGRSKLSEQDVIAIYKDDITPKMHIAKKYNIDPTVVRVIKNKITWKHVTKGL